MELDKVRDRGLFLGLIVVLIVATSYLTTAYFIHAPPFGSKIKMTEEHTISQITTEIGVEDYEVSSGKRTMFDHFSMVFPREWLLINTGEQSAILGMKPDDLNASVSISRIQMNTDLPDRTEDVQLFMSDNIDTWFATADISRTSFLNRQCFLFSGSFERTNKDDGMITLIVPDGEIFYMITGLFVSEGNSKGVVEDIISTFRLGNYD